MLPGNKRKQNLLIYSAMLRKRSQTQIIRKTSQTEKSGTGKKKTKKTKLYLTERREIIAKGLNQVGQEWRGLATKLQQGTPRVMDEFCIMTVMISTNFCLYLSTHQTPLSMSSFYCMYMISQTTGFKERDRGQLRNMS
jgi:hypothetical protein